MDDLGDGVGWDRKANAVSLGNSCRIHADNETVDVQQRTAGVPRG
jgi:hypothetical protein